MTENLQDLTKEELKALDATRKVRDNEILKYVVAAFDRLSTALLVVGSRARLLEWSQTRRFSSIIADSKRCLYLL